MEAPLTGMRILDLADEKACFCSKILADMGATVIKVESPGGDRFRATGPHLEGPRDHQTGFSYLYNHTNKRSITLNIDHPEGKKVFLQLIQQYDIVIESFPAGHLEGLGLGYRVLRRNNPELILTSVTGFGQTGPRREYKTCDLVAAAMGGQMHVTGLPSSPPLTHPGNQSYLTASLYSAVGILLAFRRRRQTGRGDHIDISLQESVIATLEHVMVRYFFSETVPHRQGALHWNRFSHILPCKDGFIHITLFEQWETLVEWMDSEGMSADLREEKYDDPQYRLDHADQIIAVIEKWTKTHTTAELFELGQLMRFPWAPVCTSGEVATSPQLASRHFFLEMEHPETNAMVTYPGMPFRLTPVAALPSHRPPRVGEHNREIYQKELGIDDQTIHKLASMGVI